LVYRELSHEKILVSEKTATDPKTDEKPEKIKGGEIQIFRFKADFGSG